MIENRDYLLMIMKIYRVLVLRLTQCVEIILYIIKLVLAGNILYNIKYETENDFIVILFFLKK
jgi:hypothetical protein